MSGFCSENFDKLADKIFETNKDFLQCLLNHGLDKKEDAIKKWRQGNSFPKTNELPIIAECLRCNIVDFFDNRDIEVEKITKKELKHNPNKYNSLLKIIDDSKIDIPYFENINACAGSGIINYEDTPKPITFNREFLETQLNMKNFKNVHIVKLKGNSMEPTFKSGTFLMINPFENEGSSVENGSIYVVRYYEDVMVKRVVRNNKTKEVLLHSDNKAENPSIEIKAEDENDFQIIGRVIANFNFI